MFIASEVVVVSWAETVGMVMVMTSDDSRAVLVKSAVTDWRSRMIMMMNICNLVTDEMLLMTDDAAAAAAAADALAGD